MIGRRQQHLGAIGKDHRLDDIHHLRDIGHAHPVGMAGEDVEIERGGNRIAQRILLAQEHEILALRAQPQTPFVDREPDLLARIIAVHDRLMLDDHVIHLERVAQDFGIVLLAEIG